MSEAKFPKRLAEMLANESSEAISWNLDGKSFHLGKELEWVLPRYFRHGSVASFQRQLNLYKFQRIHAGELKGVSAFRFHQIKGVSTVSTEGNFLLTIFTGLFPPHVFKGIRWFCRL